MDNISDLVDILRGEMPEMSPAMWEKVLTLASQVYPATTLYVPAKPRRSLTDAIAENRALSDRALAEKLHCSERHIRRIRARKP